MIRRPLRLPAGRHFAVAWHIPDDYGGMTSALLHRSRAFVRLAGVAVDVLTFDARPDYPRLEARLRESGELVPGVGLHNVYEWLRAHPLPGGRSFDPDRTPFTPLADGEGEPLLRDGVVMSRTRSASDGTVLQRDHFRPDGSLLLSDRRDVFERGVPGGRSVVLTDASGRPVRGFRRMRSLYAAWIDRLAEGEPAFLIVDSTVSAANLLDARHPGRIVVHVLHNSHLADPADPDGPLRARRRPVLERLDAFDAVVVLTDRQRAELRARVGKAPRLHVLPNSRPLDPAGASAPRDPHAVVLASLTGRKRVQHAIRAVGRIPGARLEVYGSGDRRDFLEEVAATRAPDAVVFHGHRPDARERLRTASVLLLTSRFEGSPLVLVEAMAAGCLPIAYDIRYGPRDVIRHGIDGWVVPPGDEKALTRTLREALGMPASRLERMRRAARRSARRYADEAVTRDWARLLRRLDQARARQGRVTTTQIATAPRA